MRGQRRANLAELRAAMQEWGRKLHQQGVSERAQVVVRRDRLCIPVKAGRQVRRRAFFGCPGSLTAAQQGPSL